VSAGDVRQSLDGKIRGANQTRQLRNSWGEYWGNMGFAYLKLGSNQLGVESHCSWAVPGLFTESGNFPCFEDGKNCAEKNAPADAFLADVPHFFQDARYTERAAAHFVQELQEGEMVFSAVAEL
jgi:hypothetical protein